MFYLVDDFFYIFPLNGLFGGFAQEPKRFF